MADELCPLTSASLEACEGVRHGFFTRQGGVSQPPFDSLNCSYASGDDPSAVAQNLQRVATAMDVHGVHLLTCCQVHSSDALRVTAPWTEKDGRPSADAMVTCERGVALGILTADCAPVLFADRKAGVIGAAHAGWRGAVGGVLENTIEEMEKCGAQRQSICAAIGPCIGPKSYEVDEAFRQTLLAQSSAHGTYFLSSTKQGHWLFDLPLYIKDKLIGLGVGAVDPSPADTFVDPVRFFSHRRGTLSGNPERGRMISVIVRKGAVFLEDDK